TYHTGVVQCKDSFYGQHSPGRMPASVELEAKWQAWIRAGCLGSEMESATLFTVGQYLGMRTGCVLAVMSHQERVKAGLPTERGKSYDDAITVGIEAVRNLILESR
ncbi:MAG: uridine phosphorylase, partial [Oscillospiraceae bacterium]|nr:uridine phosphorylase [Oscillospiraceae bacterium]